MCSIVAVVTFCDDETKVTAWSFCVQTANHTPSLCNVIILCGRRHHTGTLDSEHTLDPLGT